MSDCIYEVRDGMWTCIACGDARQKPVRRNCHIATARPNGAPAECIHRGSVIGQHTCETCGMRGQIADVYQCTLLNSPCVIRRWTNSDKKMAGEVKCITCRERTLEDGSKPWENSRPAQ